MNPPPHCDVLVYAMRRTGHHAYIEWLAASRGGVVAHWNDMRPESSTQRRVLFNDGVPHIDVTTRQMLDADYTIVSIEDPALIVRPSSTPSVPVLFIRDPYNCMASRIRKGLAFARNLWVEHAREAVGESDLIALHCGVRPQVVTADAWRRLHAWSAVPTYISRSSFDGDDPADVGTLDSRWQRYADDERMRRLIQDDQVAHLVERLFGRSVVDAARNKKPRILAGS